LSSRFGLKLRDKRENLALARARCAVKEFLTVVFVKMF